MNVKSIARTLAVAMIVLGTSVAAVPASAAGPQATNYHANERMGPYQGRWWPRRPGNDLRRHRHYASCSPREAVRKAHWMGLWRAGVRRIDRRVIVVAGSHRGHRAHIVFARNSRYCAVVGARGI